MSTWKCLQTVHPVSPLSYGCSFKGREREGERAVGDGEMNTKSLLGCSAIHIIFCVRYTIKEVSVEYMLVVRLVEVEELAQELRKLFCPL